MRRVEEALEHIPAERPTLNPGGGFAQGSAAQVDPCEVARKFQIKIEAAQRLRRRCPKEAF